MRALAVAGLLFAAGCTCDGDPGDGGKRLRVRLNGAHVPAQRTATDGAATGGGDSGEPAAKAGAVPVVVDSGEPPAKAGGSGSNRPLRGL